MFETSIRERASHKVEAIQDFSLLKKIVDADLKGSLLATLVKIDVKLEDEKYSDVLGLLDGISAGRAVYEFTGVERYSVSNVSQLADLKAAFESDPNNAPRLHVILEIDIPEEEFESLRRVLANGRSLLVPSRPVHGKMRKLH